MSARWESVAAAPKRLASSVLVPNRWLESYWPPVVAWFGATAAVVVWCVVLGWPPFAADKTWKRFDSWLYLGIAKHGYTLVRCTGAQHGWCGNSGWLPAYPWLVAGLDRLGSPLASTALFVAWLFGFGTVLALWEAMPSRRSRGALIAVTYAAVGPGVVYSYALYPISLLTFCTAVFLFALGRGRFALGGVAAGVAALAYPLGIVAAPAGAAWLLANRHLRLEARIRAAALVVFPTVAAALVFIGDQRLETGRWNAYFLVQRKYGHHLRDPFAAVAGADRALRHGRLLQGYHAIAIQTLLVTFVLLCVLVELVLRRGPTARFDALVALWAASTWCVALGQTNVSIWRGEAALLPMAILVRRLPTSLAAAITAAAFVVMLEMTHLYLLNLLI